MANLLKGKSINVDIYLKVWISQSFDVPIDYQIKGATPKEAYQNLIDDFPVQNVNAIEEPDSLDLYENLGVIIDSLGDEFVVRKNRTRKWSVKRFDRVC
jgi:hypothetical protein